MSSNYGWSRIKTGFLKAARRTKWAEGYFQGCCYAFPRRSDGNEPLSSTLTGRLLELASRRVWTERSEEWQEAFNQSGIGSTYDRAKIIAENIYDKAAPVPDLTPSPDRNKFLHEVLASVEATCQELNIALV